MKIACVSSSQVPSSAANSIQVMKMCQALVQNGHQVKLWVPGKVHHPWDQLAPFYGLETPFETAWIASTPALKRYDMAYLAVQRAVRITADLLYTWLPQAAVIGLRRGLSVILEVHDRPTGKLGPWLLRQTVQLRGKKRLAVITDALRQVIETEFRIPMMPEKVVIAPNGVELERYDNLPNPAEARRQLNLADKTTAVYTGHFYAGRGLDLLLKLARAFPQAQFLWIGGQVETVDAWRQRITTEGLTNIVLTGFIENKQLPLYQAAGEILLMPYETSIAGSSGGNSADICSPMKMFEYLACGRAIMSSDLPVLHEVLNEENAILCPPEDPQAWIAAMTGLLENPEKINQLGAAARKDAKRYSWRSRAERILNGFI